MVKKLKKLSATPISTAPLSGAVRDSAQQIWLAGLGAFAKAQEEGGKVFEALVKEGLGLQRKTQAVAEEKISETTSKLADIANGLTSGLSAKTSGITSMATGQWDKLENIFEDRVAKALNKLGMPSSKDVQALVVQIEELTKTVNKLSAKPASTKPVTTAKVAAVKAEAPVMPVAAPVKPAAKTRVKAVVKAAVKASGNGGTKPAATRAGVRKSESAIEVVAAPTV